MTKTANAWPPWAVRSLERGLEQLSEAVKDANKRSDDEQIWLTRFLVVRTTGYLEQVVHEVVRAYIEERSGGPAKAFSLSWLSRSRNPSPENLLDIVGRFDDSWRQELLERLEADDGHLSRELSMLVTRRHHIAHGLNEGMGTRKALELVTVARDIADWFVIRFNPDGVRT